MSKSTSEQPRKQRRTQFRAASFERHRQLTVSLSRDLRGKYHRRALPLRKGDTVRIISGSFKGREERVSKVDVGTLHVTLDNVTIKKVDQKLKPLPIRSNHLILTRLNLADPWRRRILNVSAAEVAPESETPTTETPAPATEPAETDPDSDTESTADDSEPDTETPVPRPRTPKATPTEDE